MHKYKLFLSILKNNFLRGFFLFVITLFLFEISYRYSVIDFYKAQVNALNSKELRDNKSVDFLIFGDSFSATTKEINYIDKLRKNNSDLSFMNVSVPGTGIRQVNTFAKVKIKKHQPKAIIYQVYVGNDLIDVDHLWNWEKFSAIRNLYWEDSDHFLSLGYLNQRLAILNVKKDVRLAAMTAKRFDSNLYDIRTKRFLNGDTFYLNNALMLKKDFKNRYVLWLEHMRTFLETIPNEIPVYILWVPHSAQVNDYYLNNMKALGAVFDNKNIVQQSSYPFFNEAKKDLKMYKNLKHLNPLQFFQSKDAPTSRLYYINDPHTNYYGNYVLSEFLQSQLFK